MHTREHARRRQARSQANTPLSYESRTQSVSVTSLQLLPWATLTFSFVYTLHSDWTCFQRGLQHLSYTSAAVPYLIGRRIWTSLNEHLKTGGEQKTEEKRKFCEWRLRLRLCWFLSSLCEVLGCLLPRYLSRLQNGRGSETRAGWERHIINQECFYNKAQTPSNPTHSHTLVSFSCTELRYEKKNALICQRHTSFFFLFFLSASLTEMPLIFSSLKSSRILRH